MDILKEEVGITFTHVLEDDGVYRNVHRKAEKRSSCFHRHIIGDVEEWM